MRILMAGASGLIGQALTAHWSANGYQVVRLVRGKRAGPGEISWNPAQGRLDAAAIEGFDAAVCLSGAGIADARWTPARKEELRSSRIHPASLMARSLARCSAKPKCLLCASATGVYGMDRGDEVLSETSEPGTDFLGRLCQEWEAAVSPARDAGIRVLNLRLSVVLTPEGGALKTMLLPFRLGLGGPVGTGRQYFSWISLSDVLGAIDHALSTNSLEGPINLASPHPIPNREFSASLGRALHRPALLPVPAIALRLAMGEMAGLILGSSRVYPRALEASRYVFQDAEIGRALTRMLTVSGD